MENLKDVSNRMKARKAQLASMTAEELELEIESTWGTADHASAIREVQKRAGVVPAVPDPITRKG